MTYQSAQAASSCAGFIPNSIATPAQLIIAIGMANGSNCPGADTIDLGGNTITFTLSSYTGGNQALALPSITSDITITNGGLTKSGSNEFKFLFVEDGGSLTVSNMTLSNGGGAGVDLGGAILSLGNLTVNNSTFSNNYAGAYGGGAIFMQQDSNNAILSINGSTFIHNSASYGGALLIESARTSNITNSKFLGNQSNRGGALHASSAYSSSVGVISSCIFSGNSSQTGGAIDVNELNLRIESSTLSGNTSLAHGAINVYNTTATIVNSIVFGNAVPESVKTLGETVLISYSAVEGWLGGGTGNITSGYTAANFFINPSAPSAANTGNNYNPANYDWHLLVPGSPAVDAGNNSGVPATDLDGNTRIQNSRVDMGVYESAPYVPPIITLTPATISMAEAGSSSLTISRNGSTASALTVNLNIALGAGLTAVEYTLSGSSISAQSGNATVTIPAGLSSGVLTLTTIGDAIAENNETLTLTLVDDATYDLGLPSSATVTIVDNDTAGITIVNTFIQISEAGGTATFSVVLNSQPTANVSIALSSSDTSEGTVSPASLTFTSANWNTAQTVTVTGVDDEVDDGNVSYSIVLGAATSSDTHYSIINPPDVSVVSIDNDTAGITVTPTSGLSTTEAGGTATFSVVLNSQPTANVSIALSSSDTSEGTVSPASLTFTSANWNTAQTVTVTGVEDALVDGSIGYTIVVAAATSTDNTYAGINPTDVSVTNSDNDSTTGIPTLSEWALLLLAVLMLGIGMQAQRRY